MAIRCGFSWSDITRDIRHWACEVAEAQSPSGPEFEFPTEAGARYRLEGSADLQTRTVLLDDVAGTGGVLQVRDPEAATFEGYFYRVIQK